MEKFKVYTIIAVLFLMGFVTFRNSISLIDSKLNLLSLVTNSIDDFSEEDTEESENSVKESIKEIKYLSSSQDDNFLFVSLQKIKYDITRNFQLPDVSIVPETPPPSII